MSEPKHSPLPWTDDGLDRFSGNEEWCWSIMSGADLVATVPTQHFTRPEASLDAEAKANAELIVRSVNAHADLVAIAHAAKGLAVSIRIAWHDAQPGIREAAQDLEAYADTALALAKGETK